MRIRVKSDRLYQYVFVQTKKNRQSLHWRFFLVPALGNRAGIFYVRLQEAYDLGKQGVSQGAGFQAFEDVELVEHDLALAERIEL